MKKFFLSAVVTVLTFANSWAQRPDGYLTDETFPKSLEFIWTPPSLTGGDFMNDFYYYQWGREMRENDAVSDLALYDEAAPLYEVFGAGYIGINLTYETTPEIIKLCERAVSDASKANTAVKKKYQRIRPFATFHDPSLKPETDEEEAKTFSYPSGHSSRGYIFALALCTVAPEYTSIIMDRAELYAINRVICGHHWKSDTEASLLLASAIFANVVCTDEYQAQLKKARAEYQQVLATSVDGASAEAREQIREAIYDLQGRRLNMKPINGMYIQDGRKVVVNE